MVKTEQQKVDKYTCDICGAEFTKFRSLGGHIGRSHKGQSEKSKKRNQTRSNGTQRRQALALAKVYFRLFAPNAEAISKRKYTLISNFIYENRFADLTGETLPDSWFNQLKADVFQKMPRLKYGTETAMIFKVEKCD